MNLGQLRKVITAAEGHYRSDGRGDIADALSSFAANLLNGSSSQTVASVVSRIEKARKPPVARVTSKSGRKRRATKSR